MPLSKKEHKAYRKRRRLYLLAKGRERLARAAKGGFNQINVLIDKRDNEALNSRARTMKIPKCSVARAAMREGIRHVTTSGIIQEHQRWLTLFKRPAVPRYPGADFDPALRGRGPKKGFRKEPESTTS